MICSKNAWKLYIRLCCREIKSKLLENMSVCRFAIFFPLRCCSFFWPSICIVWALTLYERIYFNVVKFDGECCRPNWSRIHFNKPENGALFCVHVLPIFFLSLYIFFRFISKVYICNRNKKSSFSFYFSLFVMVFIEYSFLGSAYCKAPIDFPFFGLHAMDNIKISIENHLIKSM